MTSLQFVRFLQASFNKSRGRDVDIADMSMGDEGSKHELDLGTFVHVLLELSVIE